MILDIGPGDKYWLKRGTATDNPSKKLIHIVSIIHDGEYTLIVYKSWNKYKQYWIYQIEDDMWFKVFSNGGLLEKLK